MFFVDNDTEFMTFIWQKKKEKKVMNSYLFLLKKNDPTATNFNKFYKIRVLFDIFKNNFWQKMEAC